jgi:hypothetical protein
MNEDGEMTGKEICEAYARFRGVPEGFVPNWAEKFWARSPTGELAHVFAAWDEMGVAFAMYLAEMPR